MPLQALQFRPGISRESTDYANSGGWYACNRIRFRSGMPERIGGWSPVSPDYIYGTCRSLTEWESLSNFLLLGLGTNLKYYINVSSASDTAGAYYDITPLETTQTGVTFDTLYGALSGDISATATTINVASSTPFYVSGQAKVAPIVVRIGSEDIYVPIITSTGFSNCVRGYNNTTAAAHTSGATITSDYLVLNASGNSTNAGDFVTLSGATGFGAYSAADLTGNFLIAAQSANYVAIVIPGIYASSYQTGQGGASVVAEFEVGSGNEITSSGYGWGTSIWNALAFGAASSTLSSDITISATSITLADASAFPSSGCVIIETEIVQYSGKSTNTLTGCTRGAVSSTATSHMAGVTVRQAVYAYEAPAPTNTFRAWSTPSYTGVPVAIRLWSADTFGQDLIYNIQNGPVYYWQASTNLSASGAVTGRGVDITELSIDGYSSDAWAPTVAARVIVTDERHVVALGTNDYATLSTSQDPLLIRWCEQENPLIWEPTQTNTAGFQRLSYGSKIVTAEKTRQEILVWTDVALYSMRYLGPPYIFGFNTLSAEITIASPNAVTTANNVTYWMGKNKFYAYSGSVDTLPCALRQYVFDDINPDQADQIQSGANEKYNEVWWMYCSSGSNYVNRYVVYNYLEKLWYYGQMPRTAWFDSHIRGYPIATMSQRTELEVTSVANGVITGVAVRRTGKYLVPPQSPVTVFAVEGLGTGATFTVYYSLAGVATSAAVVNGGTGYVVGDVLFVNDGSAMTLSLYQDYGLDDAITNPALPITSYIESADFDIGDGDHFTFVKRIIPDVDFIGSLVNTPSVTMTVSTRNYPGQGLYQDTEASVEVSSKVSVQIYNYTTQNWIRLRGRQAAFTIGSVDLGVKWQLGVPRLDAQVDGRR